MDNDKNNGRTNLKKYRTYKAADPSTSTPSMASSGTHRPTTTTHHAWPGLEVTSPKSKEKELRRKKRLSLPVPATSSAQPHPSQSGQSSVPQTHRTIDLTTESLRKQRLPAPVHKTSAHAQPDLSPVPQTRRIAIDLTTESLRRKQVPIPKTSTQPQPSQSGQSNAPVPQTHRTPVPDLTTESLRRKQRPPVPKTTQPSQSGQSPVPVPRTPVLDLTKELLRRKQHSPVPVPKTSAQPQQRQSGQSSTTSTNSRSNPFDFRTGLRAPSPTPPTPAPFSNTFSTFVRGAQSPAPPTDKSSLQQILPLLSVIKDQQTTILTQNAASDRSLHNLVAEVGKLSEWAKQKDEKTKERETKDKANEEREKEKLKALILLSQRVDDVKKRVVGIETVVGVSQGHDKTTMLDKLQNIEMDVEEWLERTRDPDAAMAMDQRRPLTPSSLSPAAPTVVRHEMAVSPIKVSSRNQAVSARTPEPVSTPKSTLVDVSTQVDTTSDKPPTQPQEFTNGDSVCASCSKNKLPSPSSLSISPVLYDNIVKRVSALLYSMNDDEMSDSTASAPSHSKGKEVSRTYMQEGPPSHQVIDDNPFQTQPNLSLGVAQETQTELGASDETPEAPCELSDRKNESPSKSRPKSEKLAISSFSPADWTKAPAPSSSAVEGPSSSRGVAGPSTIPSSGNQSYTLPPLPEGTVAALRKEVLVDPYPFPLESAGLGDGNNLVLPVGGVVGASIEAAKRMPSPESQFEEDNADDIYDNDIPGEKSMPEVCDTQLSESKRSHSPSKSLTPQSVTRRVARSIEGASVQPIQVMSAVMRKSLSVSTASSLTSLSSSAEEFSTPRASSTKRFQSSTPLATLPHPLIHPPSQTSNITEDEDTVMALVVDAPPTSPAPPPLSKTTIPSALSSASTLVLVSPEPRSTRPINSPRNDDPADKENLTKLQKWYKEQRAKVLSVQKSDKPENDSITIQKDVCDPEKADSNPNPGSPLFTSPNVSPHGPKVPRDYSKKSDNVSGNKPMSPLFTSPSVTPPKREGNVVPVRPEPPAYLKKLVEIVKDDDDVDIVPLKWKHASSVIGSEKGKEKPNPSPSLQPPKRSLLTTQNKRLPSKAKTRIKKRKVSQEPTKIEIDSEEDEDEEEDQPPLKRVKLRLNKTPASKVATSVKPKSVSSVKTPMKRVRDHPPRTASVTWPKLDNPVFDQFIECDICERWYHVGCVGIHPDDIRLSASEIYRCPPCDAGISKEALTPVKNTQGNKHDAACSRPKCLCPRKTQSIKKETTFIVERFVGMVKKSVGGRGIKLVYLVKWHGYGFEDATWEEETAMGLPDPGIFADEFEEQARKEGIDLSECNNSEAALLRCAIDAGWKRNGDFIKKEA